MVEHVGPVRARLLLEHFGDAPKNLTAAKSALLCVRNIGNRRGNFQLGKIRGPCGRIETHRGFWLPRFNFLGRKLSGVLVILTFAGWAGAAVE
jgi:hypothetical protein